MNKIVIVLLLLGLLLAGCTQGPLQTNGSTGSSDSQGNPDSIPQPPAQDSNPDTAPPNLPF